MGMFRVRCCVAVRAGGSDGRRIAHILVLRIVVTMFATGWKGLIVDVAMFDLDLYQQFCSYPTRSL